MAQHGSPDTTYGDCVAEVSSVYSIEYTPLDDALDKIVAEALDQFHVAGMALAVVGGDHIWEKVRSIIFERNNAQCSQFSSGIWFCK